MRRCVSCGQLLRGWRRRSRTGARRHAELVPNSAFACILTCRKRRCGIGLAAENGVSYSGSATGETARLWGLPRGFPGGGCRLLDNALSHRLMVLVFTDLVGSVDLKSRLGNATYA